MAVSVNPRRDPRMTGAPDATGGPGGTVVRHRPTGAALTGLAAVIVGAWAGIAGYVGPLFGYRPVAPGAWNWNMENGLLHLLPGAAAVVAGIMLLAMGPARRSVRGAALTLPALILMAAGAWLVIGPTAWPTFESGLPFVPGVSATRNLLNVAGASLAPGLVLAVLGGMAWKAATVRSIPVVVDDPMTPREARPVEAAPVATAPVATGEPVGANAPVSANEPVGAGAGRRSGRRGLFSRHERRDEGLTRNETGAGPGQHFAGRDQMAAGEDTAGREGNAL